MAGRVDHVEIDAVDIDAVAVRHAHRDDIDAALFAHHGDAVRMIAQRSERTDMIGVNVGVDRLDEAQVEFAQQAQIVVQLFNHGIDNQRLAASAAGQKIRVGAGCGVEELPENHDALSRKNDAQSKLVAPG